MKAYETPTVREVCGVCKGVGLVQPTDRYGEPHGQIQPCDCRLPYEEEE